MTNANDARKAHKILDDLFKRKPVLDEEREFLRGALPELPKQKTLEEITLDVLDAWSVAIGNDWGGNSYNPNISIEDWLTELHEQLKGLEDTPVTVPALPEGIRLADHEQYGRVITSPKPNRDGVYDLLVPRPTVETGADWDYAHECELTFIDAEPAAPAHPEYLETEADYQKAPEGTIVAIAGSHPWIKTNNGMWKTTDFDGMTINLNMSICSRRVLRWGMGDV